jgi:hypothetical protein
MDRPDRITSALRSYDSIPVKTYHCASATGPSSNHARNMLESDKNHAIPPFASRAAHPSATRNFLNVRTILHANESPVTRFRHPDTRRP